MPKSKYAKLYYVVILGLITGTLDALAAKIINYSTPFGGIFRYIASGYFGQQALSGENMVLWGLLFHYIIATAFSLMLLELQPKFKHLTKNKYLLGVIYGFLIWVVMTYAVLPLTNVARHAESPHFDKMGALKGIVALIISLGLPVAFIAEKYHMRKALRSARRKVRSV